MGKGLCRSLGNELGGEEQDSVEDVGIEGESFRAVLEGCVVGEGGEDAVDGDAGVAEVGDVAGAFGVDPEDLLEGEGGVFRGG